MESNKPQLCPDIAIEVLSRALAKRPRLCMIEAARHYPASLRGFKSYNIDIETLDDGIVRVTIADIVSDEVVQTFEVHVYKRPPIDTDFLEHAHSVTIKYFVQLFRVHRFIRPIPKLLRVQIIESNVDIKLLELVFIRPLESIHFDRCVQSMDFNRRSGHLVPVTADVISFKDCSPNFISLVAGWLIMETMTPHTVEIIDDIRTRSSSYHNAHVADEWEREKELYTLNNWDTTFQRLFNVDKNNMIFSYIDTEEATSMVLKALRHFNPTSLLSLHIDDDLVHLSFEM